VNGLDRPIIAGSTSVVKIARVGFVYWREEKVLAKTTERQRKDKELVFAILLTVCDKQGRFRAVVAHSCYLCANSVCPC